MANHRPKSLSELNNVYDKAMRAEKAIKEGSSLLSTPEKETAPKSENILEQLESKAAEAQKNQVFDPDITNIANDFLKRYAQSEKPKPAPTEIKRPAPTIQSIYHSAPKHKAEEKQDVPLNQSTGFAPGVRAQSAPLHRPAPTVPTAEAVKPAVTPPAVVTPAPVTEAPAEPESVSAPETAKTESVVTPKQPAVKTVPRRKVDYTPRPAPSRVRITSTERSELMEEYMRVMSDEDDEPTDKKPKFSFFKKKKKYDNESDTDNTESLYEELDDDGEDTAEEVSVVAFDSSDVKYTDEYSDVPLSDAETQVSSAPMSLYDYLEADMDYEDDEDGSLDISTTTFEKETPEADEFYQEEVIEEESEAIEEEIIPEEIAEVAEYPVESAEEVIVPAEVQDTEEIVESEEVGVAIAEEVIEAVTEEIAEDVIETPVEESVDEEVVIYPEEETAEEPSVDAPPSDMEFEDIFSVSDESLRSHTGGDWANSAPQETEAEYQQAEEYENDVPETQEASEYDGYDKEDYDGYDEYDDEDQPTKSKGKIFLKVIMVLAVIFSLSLAGATAFVSTFLDINSGKLISQKYRVFSADESLPSMDVSKGDLIITDNIFAHADDIYVYVNQTDNTYDIGKVLSNTSNLMGEYLYVTQSESGPVLINRDTSMGVVLASYPTVGGILSFICDYSIYLIIALVVVAIALIVCLVLIIRKNRFDAMAEEIDRNAKDDSDDSDGSSDGDDNSEDEEDYYNDYDTDGIEQGLFVSI